VVGLHNTYDDTTAFPHLAQALDAGASLLELDTWTDVFGDEWKVSHSNPFGNANNCVDAAGPADIYTGSANKDLGSCLDDIKYWLAAHPATGPIYIKVEMKAGFQSLFGMGPSQFDAYVAGHVGNILYRPADLLARNYSTPDAAATANAWPSRSALAGKLVMYLIPGTVELANPLALVHSDAEYATYVKNLSATGTLARATTFPAALGTVTGDPRSKYGDTAIRPWFVFFDGDANTYVTSVDTSWYDTHHYILIMTDAHNVAPALDPTNPPVAAAQARVAQLAADHASVVSNDWTGLPGEGRRSTGAGHRGHPVQHEGRDPHHPGRGQHVVCVRVRRLRLHQPARRDQGRVVDDRVVGGADVPATGSAVGHHGGTERPGSRGGQTVGVDLPRRESDIARSRATAIPPRRARRPTDPHRREDRPRPGADDRHRDRRRAPARPRRVAAANPPEATTRRSLVVVTSTPASSQHPQCRPEGSEDHRGTRGHDHDREHRGQVHTEGQQSGRTSAVPRCDHDPNGDSQTQNQRRLRHSHKDAQ
jgi:hypothetical protein